MKSLAGPYLAVLWRARRLRVGTMICIALTVVASAAEIAVALSLVPVSHLVRLLYRPLRPCRPI